MAKKTKPAPQPLVLSPRAGAWPADKVERRSVKDLLAYPRNPRIHSDEQVDALVRSLNEFGWTIPILVDEEGICIAGHGRLQAANRMGIEEVPVMVATGWTEDQKRAYRIADNALTEQSTWSPELLRFELGELALTHYDLKLTGFDDFKLVQYMAQAGDGDTEKTPEPPEIPATKRGDIWLLGKHRLMCGDSTSDADVALVMDGRRAVLFSTDPPYAVGYFGGSHPATKANRGNANRNKNWIEYNEAGLGEGEKDDDENAKNFYRSFLKVAVDKAIEESAPWYCWHASKRQAMIEGLWIELGAFIHQQIIWVKSRAVLTYAQYMWQHEPCLFGWIKGNRPKFHRVAGANLSTVWQVPNSEIESAEHPTSKPTRLFQIPIEQHTGIGDVIYEPFSGSGSQIIAAELLNRKCYALEISPVFVDVAVIRWQEYAKKKATLEATGQTFDEVAKERLGAGKSSKKRKTRERVSV